MRIVQGCVVLVLLAGLALIPRVASAQTGGLSDTLSETIVDLGTGGPVPITLPPPPVFVSIPEGAAEPLTPIVMPARQIDFIEGAGTTQGVISDRLTISQYEVQVQSDDTVGLPRRTNGATLIPASALESFQPIRIEAFSDGDVTNTTQSDTVSITLGYYGPGTGTPLPGSPFTIPEPLPEGATEPAIVAVIPPTFFDIVEPSGSQSIVSDYVDILNSIQVQFISADDLPTTPPAHGVVFETLQTGGGVRYSVDFFSDTDVPEPTSFILFGMGLLSFALSRRKR